VAGSDKWMTGLDELSPLEDKSRAGLQRARLGCPEHSDESGHGLRTIIDY